MPFILAVLLALLIEPAIGFMEKRLKMKRGPATLLSMLLVLGSLATALVYLVSRLINELISIYKIMSLQSGDLSQLIVANLEKAQLFYLRLNLPTQFENSLQTNLYGLVNGIQQLLNSLVNGLISVAADLPGYFIFILIAMVATYFIARERPEIREWFLQTLPESWEGKTRRVAGDLVTAFLGFVKALLILVSITGIQTIVGLKILGVDYALTIGLLVGLLDILPVLGPGTIFVPWIIISFIVGNTGLGLGLLVLYAVITAVRYMLEPRIIGDNVGLHPLATLISLYVGLKVAGVTGIVLGPIVLIMFLACRRAGVFDRWSWKRID
jgi:sporulation integral membrane protein YtvI